LKLLRRDGEAASDHFSGTPTMRRASRTRLAAGSGALVLGYPAQREFRLRPQGNSQDSGHPIGGGKDVMLENKLERNSHQYCALSVIHLERRTVFRPRRAVILDAGGGDVGVPQPFLDLGDVRLMIERGWYP
jgi:hypothetical protein